MKRLLLASSVFAAFALPLTSVAAVFSDSFYGSIMSSTSWHIPTWVSSSDGTYVGRTQFRTSQNAPLPAVLNGAAQIKLETYNPTGFSFYGTDVIANQSFSIQPGQGLDVSFRAKMNNPSPGIVGGLFLYALKPGSNTLHDEIDFELLGNTPTKVHTNVYGNEPLGVGHPANWTYPNGGTIGGYHTYRFTWLANKVTWYVDGVVIRTATANIPTGPMYLHLNIWAPASNWTEAYSATIQPVRTAAENKTWTMSVDSVSAKPITAPLTPTASFTSTPSCTVAKGYYTCSATMSWTSSNPTNGMVGLYKCNATSATYTTTSGAKTYQTALNPNRTCWQIRNMSDGAVLAQTSASVACASGASWRDTQTLNSDAGMCANWDESYFTGGYSCTVPIGGSSCTANLTWTTAPSASNLVTLLQDTSWVTVTSTGPQSRWVSISPANSMFYLRDTSSNAVITSGPAMGWCATGSTWNGSYCKAN